MSCRSMRILVLFNLQRQEGKLILRIYKEGIINGLVELLIGGYLMDLAALYS
jgi:hypothetical protein